MKFRATVTKDPVKRKLAAVERRTQAPDQNYLKWLRLSAQRTRSFWFRRFDRFSRGGGNWKSTKRRKGSRRGRKARILVLTKTLLRALSPIMRGLPGQWERIRGNSIQTGYGGSARHPQAGMTVRNLAKIHQTGMGVMPQRKIIVGLDKQTRDLIRNDANRILKS